MRRFLVAIAAFALGLLPEAQAALMNTFVLKPGSPEKACVAHTYHENTSSIQWVSHEGASKCPESVPALALTGPRVEASVDGSTK